MKTRYLGWAVVSVALAAVGTGCFDYKISSVSQGLVVETSLRFRTTPVLDVSELDLVVTNPFRARSQVTTETTGPFNVGELAFVLEPGESRTMKVRFAPDAEGQIEGKLSLMVEASRYEVALSGKAVASCQPIDGCHTASFEVATEVCSRSQAQKGTPCTLPCHNLGACDQGLCYATPLDCSDGNLCTDDLCDPAQGCITAPTACPPPSDPCRAQVCDPEVGCGEVNVVDGTRCGAWDCSQGLVCQSGACVLQPTAEETECAPATICRGASVCRTGGCTAGAETPLEMAWERTAAGRSAQLVGTTGVDDSAVWFESKDNSVLALAGAGGGAFRREFAGGTGMAVEVSSSGAEIVWGRESKLEGFSRGGGEGTFSLDLRSLLGSELGVADGGTYTGKLNIVSVVSAMPAWAVAVAQRPGSERAHLVALQGTPPQLLFKLTFERGLKGLVADAEGNLYASVPKGGGVSELVSWTSAGAERFRVAAKGIPLAVDGARVFLDDGEVRGEGGALAFRVPGTERPWRVFTQGKTAYVLTRVAAGCLTVSRISTENGALGSSTELCEIERVEEPALSSSGNVILPTASRTTGAWKTFIREVGPTGELASCPLPVSPNGPGEQWSSSAFGFNGFAVTSKTGSGSSIRYFRIPGIDISGAGWRTAKGNPGRQNRSQ